MAEFERDRIDNRCYLLRSSEWNPDHVEGAPTALFGSNGNPINLKCITVIACSEKFWVRQIIKEKLTDVQREIVTTSDPDVLASRFALCVWPDKVDVKFKILYANERDFKLDADEAMTGFESDDSDEFDELSSKDIRSGKFVWNSGVNCDLIDNDREPLIMRGLGSY